MSSISTLSVFYYGHTITRLNNKLPFTEGAGPQLVANLKVGNYTLTRFAAEIERALNASGALTYTVSVNRSNRKITISASGIFALLCFSGTVNSVAVWDLLGANTTSDKTGATTYLMDNASGYEYRVQSLLDKYTSPDDFEVIESSAVSIAASGKVNVVSFGDGARMICNITLITNKTGIQNNPFYNNANGIQDAKDFLNYVKTKAEIEFMPDVADRDIYFELLLDSSKADRDGTSMRLYDGPAQGFFETGEMTFRKVI